MSKVVMPYTIGEDPETGEIMVADVRTMTFILRGPAVEKNAIFELVNAANDWFANVPEETSSDAVTDDAGDES